jgi:hypothetical protein
MPDLDPPLTGEERRRLARIRTMARYWENDFPAPKPNEYVTRLVAEALAAVPRLAGEHIRSDNSAVIARLSAQVEAAQADSARLDWLDAHGKTEALDVFVSRHGAAIQPSDDVIDYGRGVNIRIAIDAAMASCAPAAPTEEAKDEAK